jgi:hypothetical protein
MILLHTSKTIPKPFYLHNSKTIPKPFYYIPLKQYQNDVLEVGNKMVLVLF